MKVEKEGGGVMLSSEKVRKKGKGEKMKEGVKELKNKLAMLTNDLTSAIPSMFR